MWHDMWINHSANQSVIHSCSIEAISHIIVKTLKTKIKMILRNVQWQLYWIQLPLHNTMYCICIWSFYISLCGVCEHRSYNSKLYDVYRMPVEVMRVGMVCAAQYIHSSSSDWHRCVITGFSDGFVQVCTFIDTLMYCSSLSHCCCLQGWQVSAKGGLNQGLNRSDRNRFLPVSANVNFQLTYSECVYIHILKI